MMLLEFDNNPNIPFERRLQSLKESVQRALEMCDTDAITEEDIERICVPLLTGELGEGRLPGGNSGGNTSMNGELPIASRYELGCVVIGDGINVRADGTIWVEQLVYDAMSNSEIDSICK